MMDTPEGKARFESYEDRVNRAIAARGPQEASAAQVPAAAAPAAPTRHVTFDTRVESHDVEGAVGVPPEDAHPPERLLTTTTR